MNTSNSSAPNPQLFAVLFVILLFAAQALVLVTIMDVNFMLNMLALLSDAADSLISLNMLYIIAGPWVVITITCGLSLWFIRKQRWALSYLIAVSPVVAVAVSIWAWSAIPTTIFMGSDSPRAEATSLWMHV